MDLIQNQKLNILTEKESEERARNKTNIFFDRDEVNKERNIVTVQHTYNEIGEDGKIRSKRGKDFVMELGEKKTSQKKTKYIKEEMAEMEQQVDILFQQNKIRIETGRTDQLEKDQINLEKLSKIADKLIPENTFKLPSYQEILEARRNAMKLPSYQESEAKQMI